MTRLKAFFFALILGGCGCVYAQQEVSVRVDFNKESGPMDMQQMALGQGGLSEEPMLRNTIPQIRALNPGIIRLFVSEYYRVIDEEGNYDFTTLDQTISDILKTGAKPFMSFCLKPKLFFPVVDHDITEPNDYQQWEAFVYRVVRHYVDMGAGIEYWEVGNEVDIGEYGGTPYRFKPEDYVRYYRHTVNAILKADPTAKVGGPALADYKSPIMPVLIDSCAEAGIPLDFLSWHHYGNDPRRCGQQVSYVNGLLQPHAQLDPELIINEWNMDLFNPSTDPRFQPCYVAESIWQMKEAGVDWSSYYHIQDWHVSYDTFAEIFSPFGTAFMTRWWNRQVQMSGLFDFQGQLRPAYFTFKFLSRLAGNRVSLVTDSDVVHGFAANDTLLNMHNMMLWNFSDTVQSVRIDLANVPRDMRARHVVLNVDGNTEDQQLKATPFFELEKGEQALTLQLQPWAVHYWSLE